jgi:hypothetical protein
LQDKEVYKIDITPREIDILLGLPGGIIKTGTFELRTTFSAMLPNRNFSKPVLPMLPMTMISFLDSSAI